MVMKELEDYLLPSAGGFIVGLFAALLLGHSHSDGGCGCGCDRKPASVTPELNQAPTLGELVSGDGPQEGSGSTSGYCVNPYGYCYRCYPTWLGKYGRQCICTRTPGCGDQYAEVPVALGPTIV